MLTGILLFGSACVGCVVGYVIGHRFGTWHSDAHVSGAYHYGGSVGRRQLNEDDTSDIGVGGAV